MQIKMIHENKKQFLDLLLLGDEQESMIDTNIPEINIIQDASPKAVLS